MELLVPIVRRVLFLLVRKGIIQNVPILDGKSMKAKPVSLLARQQSAEEVNNVVEFLGIIAQTQGPQMVNVITDPIKTAKKVAELKNIDPSIMREEADREQMLEAMQQQQTEPQTASGAM